MSRDAPLRPGVESRPAVSKLPPVSRQSEDRLQVKIGEEETTVLKTTSTVRVAVSSLKQSGQADSKPEHFSFTLSARSEQNPYSAELAAIAYALRRPLRGVTEERITVVTSNKEAALSLKRPHQQSRQAYIRSVYNSVEEL
ncbi:hypothetical protein LZ30DRAFT_695152 [Colletotrichum cereale]|nr:hypothetical protein LZ30DRAFT_695152 [Colletotrichum cereale]